MEYTATLLRTKLHRPQVGQELVRRPRLEDRLDQDLDRKLTLVSAPAGFGKTTLVCQWLEACDRPAAWLSLDERDNDLTIFLRYLIAAIRTLDAEACPMTQSLLDSPQLPPVEYLTTSLINELDQVPQDFILVLDDYHRIQSQPVHQIIEDLLQYLPRPIHIILITRADPPLPLATLRFKRKMLDLRSDDLRFTLDESQAFFQQSMGLDVDPESVAALEERTEGWIVGLRLAALSLRDDGDPTALAKSFKGSDRHMADYLVAEVLSRQPQDVHDIMLRSSILERFCSPLLEALIACGDGASAHAPASGCQETLEWMEQANLFLVPLDAERIWYRYHHLFQELLYKKLQAESSEEAIAQMHLRASRWFAENGLIDEAIQHALAADDVLRAAEMVEQNRIDLMNADQWQVLERWLDRLPSDIKQGRPNLLLAQAWVHMARFRVWESISTIESVEAILGDDETDPALRGEIDFFMGYQLYWQNQGVEGFQFLQRALERLPSTYLMPHSEAQYLWGMAGQQAGKKGMVVKGLIRMLTKDFAQQDLEKSRLLGSLGFIHLISGELIKSEERIQQAIAWSNNPYLEAWIHYTLGVIHYCWNDLEKAAHYFEQAGRNRYAYQFRAAADCLVGLTLTYQALQQPKKARETLELLHEFASETNEFAYITFTRSCQTHLSLLQGDMGSAVRLGKTIDVSMDVPYMFFWLEIPRITQCRVLIAEGSVASLDEADVKLQGYIQENEAVHNTFQLIHLLLLLAILRQKQGRMDKALTTLQRAVILAQPGGFIRAFTELGPEMAQLLYQVAELEIDHGYVGQILAAFPHSPPLYRDVLQPSQTTRSELVEPLTKREQEILELMARRLSDKEIARILHVSPYTVSKHASNLYNKLQVTGRKQAVAKAKALGVLPPE
jgi:LuxR family maltose regulon positive regulatory protein